MRKRAATDAANPPAAIPFSRLEEGFVRAVVQVGVFLLGIVTIYCAYYGESPALSMGVVLGVVDAALRWYDIQVVTLFLIDADASPPLTEKRFAEWRDSACMYL